ncbi:MAG: MarR family transcriptional regulator [Bacilli bacterium]|nr:MarR family transcriptional regulator [Bacilli bacterium]
MNEDNLKISNQLCFPLYACSKEIIKKYKPLLDNLDLTYTQYIVMMVMWEQQEINVTNLGKILYLDSGTLTPVLKKLEEKKYLLRSRNKSDERILNVKITKKGNDLKNEAKDIYQHMSSCISLSKEDSITLYNLLYKILNTIS